MFFGIKCNTLKFIGTLPKIWIQMINDFPHCWIPKTSYNYKFKHRVPPPEETDVEGRKQWHFAECEILFGKTFPRFNDCEMAISSSDCDLTWLMKYSENQESHEYFKTPMQLDTSMEQTSAMPTESILTNHDKPTVAIPTEPFLPAESISTRSSDPIDTIPATLAEPFLAKIAELTHVTKPIAVMPAESISTRLSDPIDTIPAILAEPMNVITVGSIVEIETTPPMVTEPSAATTIDPTPASPAKCSAESSNSERHKENIRLCKLYNFPPPMKIEAFRKFNWTFIKTVKDELEPGYTFKTLEELKSIRRKFNDPFCWPGPIEYNPSAFNEPLCWPGRIEKERGYFWFLIDSIVQEVYFKSNPLPFYVVRWRGYGDEYNTVEPVAHLRHTAVLELFKKPKLFTACGMSGCVLRSGRRITEELSVELPMHVGLTPYESAIGKLMVLLSIEEKAGRFRPKIGFYSHENVIAALTAQHTFLFKKFLPIVKELESRLHVDKHYVGRFCGNLSKAAAFQDVAEWETNTPRSIKDYITDGLNASGKTMSSEDTPHYVTFFAPKKLGSAQKKTDYQLNFHMCLLTVRSKGNVKDAIYFDPSPFNRNTSNTIESIRAPKFASFTKNFGVVTENNDCLFQCMEYIIGLATGHRTFDPDPSKPARKLELHMQNRLNKKRKI